MKKSLLALLLAACGGGYGDAVTMESAEAPCEESCMREVMCGEAQDLTLCTAECVGDTSTGALAQGAVDKLADCLADLPCNSSDDVCEAQLALQGYQSDLLDSCTAATAVCSEVSCDGLSDVAPLLSSEFAGELEVCFGNSSCATIFECLVAVRERYGFDDI